jgi:hypothetical protein
VGPNHRIGGVPGGWGSPGGGLNIFQQAPGRFALGMDPEDLLDAIEDLSPEAQYLLLISIANHLRAAVEDGRIGSVVLTQAADHLRMLVDGGPVPPRQ